jgi:hypothetical protein
MQRHDSFHVGDRYYFDFDGCKNSDGWCQIDTEQDASYYGNWINPAARRAITFAEGDLAQIKFDNDQEMIEWLERFAAHPGLCFLGVDPGLHEGTVAACKERGIDKFFHDNRAHWKQLQAAG